jgi:hypothetical protein
MNLENLIINQECIICLESIDNKQTIDLNEIDIFPKDCEHKNNFHSECINKWIEDSKRKNIKPACPLCRNQLNEIILNIPDEVSLNRPVVIIHQTNNDNDNIINNIYYICKSCQITCAVTISLLIVFGMFVPYWN